MPRTKGTRPGMSSTTKNTPYPQTTVHTTRGSKTGYAKSMKNKERIVVGDNPKKKTINRGTYDEVKKVTSGIGK